MQVIHLSFDTLPSTNTWIKENARTLTALTCVRALEQTAGRGRFDRTWISPKGENLTISLFLPGTSRAPYLPNLGQLLALATAETLLKLGLQPELKWPNDLLLNGKKVGGILSEVVPEGAILGLGLNVHQTDFHAISQPATSLFVETHKRWDLNLLLNNLCDQFLELLPSLQAHGFAALQASFNALLASKDKPLTVGSQTGICRGVDETGRLLLQTPEGAILRLVSP